MLSQALHLCAHASAAFRQGDHYLTWLSLKNGKATWSQHDKFVLAYNSESSHLHYTASTLLSPNPSIREKRLHAAFYHCFLQSFVQCLHRCHLLSTQCPCLAQHTCQTCTPVSPAHMTYRELIPSCCTLCKARTKAQCRWPSFSHNSAGALQKQNITVHTLEAASTGAHTAHWWWHTFV